MSSQLVDFSTLILNGVDAEKFLQGQLTLDVSRLVLNQPKPTAICDLKGRIAFGLWIIKVAAESFQLFVASDLATSLQAHIKKYAAFSKLTTSEAQAAFPVVIDGQPCFSLTPAASDAIAQADNAAWQRCAIAQGDYWISAATAGLFQPQTLRLHQRGGVDYDKGCYLGQEIVARLWFRASPKTWLHRVAGTGAAPQAGSSIAQGMVEIVNGVDTPTGWEGLVVATPEQLSTAGLTALALPPALMGSVARTA